MGQRPAKCGSLECTALYTVTTDMVFPLNQKRCISAFQKDSGSMLKWKERINLLFLIVPVSIYFIVIRNVMVKFHELCPFLFCSCHPLEILQIDMLLKSFTILSNFLDVTFLNKTSFKLKTEPRSHGYCLLTQ